ncbi:MAG: 50S ribosomal protein L29, partial [Streptococcus suis]
MKLQEIKDFVKELRGLSQEELAKKENELKK